MFKRVLERTKEAIRHVFSSRLIILIIFFCVLSAILIGRLFYLQIVRGEYYLENYKLQILKTREIAGTRGNIYDRNGNLLAYNELAYSVTIEDTITSDDRNATLNGILEKVMEIVESNGDSVISSFGVVLDSAGNYQFSQSSETSRLRFIADVYGQSSTDDLTEEQRNSSAEDIINYLCTDDTYGYGIDIDNLERDYVLKLVNMRYAISLNSYQQYIPTVLASDVSDETAAAIMENLDELEGVDIEEESLRRYTDSEYFASVIGYTGQISQEEYDALDEDQQEKYSLSDIVGKAGIEQVMDEVLQGEKGETTYYVNNVGKVTDVVSTTEAEAGNDVYLTLDMDLQKEIYQLIEEKLAGIILAKLSNVLDYDASTASNTSNIVIPVGDAYNAFIANEIIDASHFSDASAGAAEQEVYATFSARKEAVMTEIMNELNGQTAYQDLSEEMQAYMDYISIDILEDSAGILDEDAIDTSDETYQAWANEETISLNQYLNYAISQNWIDTSALEDYISSEKYSDAAEVYQAILSYLQDYLSSDTEFDKLLYEYLIKSGSVTGAQICAIAYEQGVIDMDEAAYNGLRSGTVDAYSWLYEKIETLTITPGQLALEPCSGSAVVSDPNTGEVLACVSYPGYDNNRLANTMDSDYYSQLVTSLSSPFYNKATQERTAPGSTYKMVSAVAGLTEGIITSNTYINCTGTFSKVTPSSNCWIYPGAHGSLNVVGAIQNSCNVFFYEVGYELGLDSEGNYDSEQGIETLAKYAEMFGLGQQSGIEIEETDPQISDEYSVQSAIGQGTNNYTVSQLNRYVAAVANSGTVYELTLIDKTTDSDGSIIKDYGSTVVSTIDEVSDTTWDLVHSGMEAVVDNSSVFSGLEVDMAGKTGTAEQSSLHPDHVLFVGYAPTDNPEIAIAVRIANGYSSSYTAEIGRDVVRLYYDLDDTSEIITGQAASLGTTTSGD